MLKRLAGLVGAAILLVFAIVLVTCKNQYTAQQYQADGQENSLPASVPLAHGSESKDRTKTGYSTPSCWQILLAWPQGITTWAILFTLFVIGWQSWETARAASAAERTTAHLIASERAWILVAGVNLTAGASDAPEGDMQVFVQCSAKNEGRSPGRVLGMKALWATGPISDPGQTWDESLYETVGFITPRWVMLPGKYTALHFAIPGYLATPGQPIKASIGTGEALFIHGVIRYWDMFSEQDRFTQFCYRWREEVPGKKAGYYPAGGERYNQQT